MRHSARGLKSLSDEGPSKETDRTQTGHRQRRIEIQTEIGRHGRRHGQDRDLFETLYIINHRTPIETSSIIGARIKNTM